MQQPLTAVQEEFQPYSGVITPTGISYMRAGSGDALVLLHGWGGFPELWWGTMRALSPDHDVLALALPQYAATAYEADSHMLDRLAELAVDACAELGLRRVTLIGHSLGGNVAIRAALAQPALVARLVLVNAVADVHNMSRISRLYSHPRFGKEMIRLGQHLMHPLTLLGRRVPHDHGGGWFRPLARRTSYLDQMDAKVLFEYMVALHGGSLGDCVSEIRQPTLVLSGERDPHIHSRQARELTERIPNADLQVLPAAYHNPMDDCPAAFYQALLDWLNTHPCVNSPYDAT